MIELSSVFVVLMSEALIGLLILVVGFSFFFKSKNSAEQTAAGELIDKLEDTENIKAHKVSEIIAEHCEIDADDLERLLLEIKVSERALYQQIIQMFLNRDVDALKNLDQYIENISDPYCEIISYSSETTVDVEQLQLVENEVIQLKEGQQRLAEQLAVAMSTMDEVSAEYTRVFSGTQTELELENSSKKMFAIFRQAEKQVKAACVTKKNEML